MHVRGTKWYIIEKKQEHKTKLFIVKKHKSSNISKSYHEIVPWHGGNKFIEQISKTQFINNPVITVTFNYGFVKVKNHNNISHNSDKENVILFF